MNISIGLEQQRKDKLESKSRLKVYTFTKQNPSRRVVCPKITNFEADNHNYNFL